MPQLSTHSWSSDFFFETNKAMLMRSAQPLSLTLLELNSGGQARRAAQNGQARQAAQSAFPSSPVSVGPHSPACSPSPSARTEQRSVGHGMVSLGDLIFVDRATPPPENQPPQWLWLPQAPSSLPTRQAAPSPPPTRIERTVELTPPRIDEHETQTVMENNETKVDAYSALVTLTWWPPDYIGGRFPPESDSVGPVVSQTFTLPLPVDEQQAPATHAPPDTWRLQLGEIADVVRACVPCRTKDKQ